MAGQHQRVETGCQYLGEFIESGTTSENLAVRSIGESVPLDGYEEYVDDQKAEDVQLLPSLAVPRSEHSSLT